LDFDSVDATSELTITLVWIFDGDEYSPEYDASVTFAATSSFDKIIHATGPGATGFRLRFQDAIATATATVVATYVASYEK